MAGCSNKIGKCDEISCDVRFDGGLKSGVRATLVNELVKYLLYERRQIPMTYNEIKVDISKSNRSHFKDKKARDVLSATDQLFTKMMEAFECCPEIDKLLLVLGGTIVSPKEMYLVNFPPPCPHVEPLAQRASTMCLFRQLISLDPLGQAKSIAPTTMSILLLAPRCSGLSWFVPKPTYKVPTRGKQFVLNFICKQPATFSSNLSATEEVEISGIEPLEFSAAGSMSGLISPDQDVAGNGKVGKSAGCHEGFITPVSSHRLDKRTSITKSATLPSGASARSSVGSLEEFKVPQPVSDITNLQVLKPCLHSTPVPGFSAASDSIWFLAPVTIKGYRDKPASGGDLGPEWLN